jgi:hypothetical protein
MLLLPSPVIDAQMTNGRLFLKFWLVFAYATPNSVITGLNSQSVK